MSLETAINEYPAGWSHAEVLDALRARTVSTVGILAGAELQGLLIGAGIMPYVHDTANDTSFSDPVFRGICIGLVSRFNPDLTLLDTFLAESTVASALNGGPYGSVAAFRAAVLSKAEKPEPEFPTVSMRDVVSIREPALATETTSLPITIQGESGVDQEFRVRFTEPPEPITPIVQFQHTLGAEITPWRGSAIAGFTNISEGGDYRLKVPGELIGVDTKVRVKVP